MQTATNAGTDDGVAVLGVPRRPLAQARRVALCLSVVLALGMGTASSAWASGSIIGWGDVAKVDRGLDLGQVNAIAPVATCESGTSGACPEGPYLTGVEEVSAGNGFSLARLSGGRVLTWSGLGDGLDSVPVLLCAVGVAAPCPSGPYLEHVTEISAGTSSGEHALALLSDGQVVSWGTGNYFGELGDGTESPNDVPEYVCAVHTTGACPSGPYLSHVEKISAGGEHGLALEETTGRVLAWGKNTEGALGNGTYTGDSCMDGEACNPNPGYVCEAGTTGPCDSSHYLEKVTAISAGREHSLALLASNKVVAWGGNPVGQLGNGTVEEANVPELLGLSNVAEISAGYYYSLARLAGGTVEAWGENRYGQLGDGTTANSLSPTPVSGLTATQVSAGYTHSLALEDGSLMAWGGTSNGALPNGTNIDSEVPAPLSLPSGVTVNKVSNSAAGDLALLNGAFPVGPIAVTGMTSSVTPTSAVLGGTVSARGYEAFEEEENCYFEWGQSLPSGKITECGALSPFFGYAPEPVSAGLTGLAPNTTYKYKAIAYTGNVKSSADEGEFTTLLTSGSGTSNGSQAAAADPPLTATAFGSNGTVTVGQYGADHGGLPPLMSSNGEYFDVYLSSGNSFTKLDFTICGLPAGASLQWDDGGTWKPVKREKPGSPGCIEVEIEGPGGMTSPELKDMTGTVFGVTVSATGPTCTSDSGTVKLAPGLTGTPAVQTLTINGILTGCTGEPFTEAAYTATLKTAGPVSCSVLTGEGEPATGPARFKWRPKMKIARGGEGTLRIALTELPGVAFSGEVSSGSYSPLTLTGTLSQSYTGGATCGVKVGNRSAKPVRKGTFTGS